MEGTAEITIVLSCFNKEKYIAQAIQSVLSQSVKEWRLIIVDDCSTDNSINIIKSFENLNNVQTLFNTENKGANYCRNLGLALASTEYLMFLDGDDVLEKTCVENRLTAAAANVTANLMVFTMGVFKENIGDSEYVWLPEVSDPLRNLLSHNLSWSIVQPLWNTNFLKSLNGFDLSFKRLQDVELNTRALLHSNLNLKMFNSTPDCYYRIDPERLNYDLPEFLDRWVDASVQYVIKFTNLAPLNYRKFLRLTLYQTYLQILYYRRTRKIDDNIFDELERKLLTNAGVKSCLGNKAWLFSMSSFFNRYLKLPGVNFVIRKCIIM